MSMIRGGYVDVATIKDDQTDMIAVISQRVGHIKFTVAFFKCFERLGRVEKSTFMDPDVHFPAVMRLIPRSQKKIEELEKAESAASASR